jgi:hypothetical protein
MVAAAGPCGYWVATADGAVTPFGTAPDLASLAGKPLNWPVIGNWVGFTQDSFDANGWIVQATVTLSEQTPAIWLHEDLQHELGHAIGLGHAPRRGQVMDPIMNDAPDYQAGDLTGLRLLGPAGNPACRP